MRGKIVGVYGVNVLHRLINLLMSIVNVQEISITVLTLTPMMKRKSVMNTVNHKGKEIYIVWMEIMMAKLANPYHEKTFVSGSRSLPADSRQLELKLIERGKYRPRLQNVFTALLEGLL